MENNPNVIRFLLNNDTIGSVLCNLLREDKYDELVQLSPDVSLPLESFISLLIEDLHQQTNWLFKEPAERGKHRKSTPNAQKSNNETPVQARNSKSPKKYDGRQRPRVQLFGSPLRGENSPSSPLFSASTPKQFHNQSNNSSDSLASPLWQNSHSPSGRHRRNSNSNHPCDDSGNRRGKLTLGDFVIKESPKGKNRRIKPTMVTPDSSRTIPSDGPFSLESPVSEKSSIDERIISKMDAVMTLNFAQDQKEAEKIETSKNDSETESKTPINYDLSLVTHLETLETLAGLFGQILCKNLCGNLMSELYYLTNLIIAEDNPKKAPDEPPLNTLNNCAYFAVMAFSKLGEILSLLSSTTLGLLAAQPAVAQFGSNLKNQLESLSHEKLNKPNPLILVAQDGNVSFQYDTDNSENFASNAHFSNFRRQRDGLYNLLQTWEKSQNYDDFKFEKYVASGVRQIIKVEDDPTNILHFARLFRNQLLVSCAIYSPSLDEAGEEVLEMLPSVDRDRLSRLQARFSKPSNRRGPAPRPDFPGRQMFFKDFILTCGPGIFNHFLQLCLVDELLRINEFEFSSGGCDSFADDLTQKRYFESVVSARLLAKFLAFSESLPYHCKENLSEQVVNLHCATRQRVLPLFDLESCLLDAVKNHRLVLTLPWIIEYLSLMDAYCYRLPAYAKIWRNLNWLRRRLPNYLTPLGRFMLQLSLGWLFEITQKPVLEEEALKFSDGEKDLDDIEVVSEMVLHHVCPFINELNALLVGNCANRGRHIRPTPAQPSSSDRVKQLELRLEETFLQNQSQSTRKTILFVEERVSACCIKEMAEILPKIRQKIKQEYENSNNIKEAVENWETEVKSALEKTAFEMCRSRSAQSLRGLLWKDVDEAVIVYAIDLTTRQSMEKVRSWLQINELNNQTEMINFLQTNNEKIAEPENDVDFLTDLLTQLREIVVKTELGILKPNELVHVLDFTRQFFSDAKYLQQSTEYGILCMLIECLTEIANSDLEISKELWHDLAGVIKQAQPNRHPLNPMDRILCERNLQFPRKRLMWLLIFLVDEELLTCENALKQAKNCPTKNLSQELKDELLNTINVLEQKNIKK